MNNGDELAMLWRQLHDTFVAHSGDTNAEEAAILTWFKKNDYVSMLLRSPRWKAATPLLSHCSSTDLALILEFAKVNSAHAKDVLLQGVGIFVSIPLASYGLFKDHIHSYFSKSPVITFFAVALTLGYGFWSVYIAFIRKWLAVELQSFLEVAIAMQKAGPRV